MQTSAPRPLEAVFLVDFSDYSFRTIPFAAQLVDSLAVHLTLLHVRAPGEDESLARERLGSFFPESSRYSNCERVLLDGPDVVEAVKRYAAGRTVDVVLAPASNALTALRLGHLSRRLHVLERLQTPVWSFGSSCLGLEMIGAPTKEVACWVDVAARSSPQVPFAVEYARRLGAQLHLLTALPEVTLAMAHRPEVPLHAVAATEKVLALAGPVSRKPHVVVAHENSLHERLRLLRAIGAQVVFVPQERAPLFEYFGARPRWLNDSPCPVVMVPAEPRVSCWQLVPRANWHELNVVKSSGA